MQVGGGPATPRALLPTQRIALRRGWHRQCPNCGSGAIMKGYLSVRGQCPVCQQHMGHQGGDTCLICVFAVLIGAGGLGVVSELPRGGPVDPLMRLTSCAIGTVALSLYLLPRIKGALVALRWLRHRMHAPG